MLLGIIASAKYCQVGPGAWLNAVFRELPQRLANAAPHRPPDLTDLLPDNWLKAHPDHHWEIDDVRQEERRQSREQKRRKHRQRLR